ncbi:MAG TPA: helix-turn-helix transcriptional regulator [Methylobacter sp.]|jgi:transcriptional regulator with XRE-family HTH domain
MKMQKRFGRTLQALRKTKGLTQEEFSLISSRTYMSSLERGLKSPTMTKLDEIAPLLGVHPVTLFALGYALNDEKAVNALCDTVRAELLELLMARAG